MSSSLDLKAALRALPTFSDLTEEQLDWFISASILAKAEDGELLIEEGSPADSLFVLLEGAVRARKEKDGGDSNIFTAEAGQVTGLLPFSRMETFGVSVRARGRTVALRLYKNHFEEMLKRIPQLTPRLVGLLSDRIREVSRRDQQQEKLMALGKLSAGLAHELNNPASAAKRAAGNLRNCTRELRTLWSKLEVAGLNPADLQFIADLETEILEDLASMPVRDSLQQSDLEDEVANWLEENGIVRKAIDPAILVEAGMEASCLHQLKTRFTGEILSDVIARVVTAISVEKLASEVESSAMRITELVGAVKEYSYMDQAPEQEIDVHRGIDNTLTMLKYRLKHGIKVNREYDTSLPLIRAFGSELNQVWTNLIENAADAMNNKGNLHIRTKKEFDNLLIEIEDDGPGIPREVQGHIFEPFFTTKGVGSGTGLGLDTAYRIIQKHGGAISFTSQPGKTVFQIRLWPHASLPQVSSR
jgi:signal transduction histidine kinase